MSDLAEWLSACVDEDDHCVGQITSGADYCDALEGVHLDKERALREVAFKREVIGLCATGTDGTGGRPLAIRILHGMAGVYSDRPGHQEAVS